MYNLSSLEGKQDAFNGMTQPQLSTLIQNINSIHDKKIERQKLTVKWLGVIEFFLAFLCLIGGFVEVAMLQGKCDGEWHTKSCYHLRSVGQGIWCSVFPLLNGILGIVAGSKTKKPQFRLYIGFCIAGAASMLIMIFDEVNLMMTMQGSHKSLQIFLSMVAAINMVLQIFSAAFCCFVDENCCCCEPKDELIDVGYVANPGGNGENTDSTALSVPQV